MIDRYDRNIYDMLEGWVDDEEVTKYNGYDEYNMIEG